MTLVALALAAVVGLALGLLGGGGSILMVPILVYLLGYAAKTAIAMSLPIVGATSLVGALGHWRAGNVQVRTALLFGLVAMAGSFAGARLAARLSGTVQLVILGFVILAAALSMLKRRHEAAAQPGLRPATGLLVIGFAVGVLTGVVGIGGGFLIVPALVLLGRVPMKQAVGTSLLVIAMNALAGSAGYLGSVALPWDFIALFTAVAITGTLAGTLLARRVPAMALRRGFAAFLFIIGGLVLLQSVGHLQGATP